MILTQMEQTPDTDPRLAGVLQELMAHEPIFHRPELGTSRADFERMTETTFREVGASGRRYDREYVLNVLESRSGAPQEEDLHAQEFHCHELAENLYLLTYTLFQGARQSRRATIWRRTEAEWKIVYHQGTLVAQD